MTTPLPDVAPAADEAITLVQFLDFLRAVARRKAEGLTDTQVSAPLAGHPSPLTIAGVVFHLASVEDFWWQAVCRGGEVPEPWRTPWSAGDDDFDLRAEGLTAQEVLAQLDASIDAGRTALAEVASLDQPAVAPWHGETVTVRWILVHLIEEYARHCGHLDLLREAADGTTGD